MLLPSIPTMKTAFIRLVPVATDSYGSHDSLRPSTGMLPNDAALKSRRFQVPFAQKPAHAPLPPPTPPYSLPVRGPTSPPPESSTSIHGVQLRQRLFPLRLDQTRRFAHPHKLAAAHVPCSVKSMPSGKHPQQQNGTNTRKARRFHFSQFLGQFKRQQGADRAQQARSVLAISLSVK